jgi:hypothetical protein
MALSIREVFSRTGIHLDITGWIDLKRCVGRFERARFDNLEPSYPSAVMLC